MSLHLHLHRVTHRRRREVDRRIAEAAVWFAVMFVFALAVAGHYLIGSR